MNTLHQNIIVNFEYDRETSLVKQDNGLFVPERYVIEEGDEDADAAYGVTTDRRLINPQVVNILSGDYAGLRAFVHYGAFEVAKWINEEQGVIPDKMILFFVDPISCVPGTYLGEEVHSDYERSAGGIILSTSLETKEPVKIKITHCPGDAHPLVKVGTTIITVDSFQYDLVYEGKKYIKVDQREIVAVETPAGYQPIGNVVLVDYLPDTEWEQWKISNEDAREEYVDKYYPHLEKSHARTLYPKHLEKPEPKFTHVRVLAIGDKVTDLKVGDKLMVYRNYGCRLPNGQWILNMDVIIGVILE